MKTKTCLAGIFLVAALADAETVTRQQLVFASNAPVILTATATNDLNSALQRGLFEEEGNRDLPAAISAYQSLAAQFDQSRQVVAMVIFRLGECYRKLGRTNEAVAQYERIGREFSDQQTLATLSRQNLARLNVRETTPASTTNADAELLAKLKKLSPSELEQVLPTLMPDNALATLLQERNTARQDRVKLSGTKTYDHPEIQNQDALIKELDNRIHERINGILLAMEIRAGQLQAAGVADKETPAGADDEDKEIRRLQAMLQNSPDLVNSTSQGAAPLQQAAGAGQLRVSVFLLDHGAKINLKSGGQTALHGATENGNMRW